MIPPIASRFVAGEVPAVALDHARRTNEDGVKVILNLLGEHYREQRPADEDAAAYRGLVEDIAGSGLDACISVKPSQIGLDVGEDVFRRNFGEIVAHASERDVFVWCDMEDHTTTDATLNAYEEFAREFDGGVGVCVQANLRRTREDLDRLADVPGKVRLVKGAYDEPSNIAYTKKGEVDEAYREDLEFVFDRFDGGVAVGSHDPAMIRHAIDLHEEHGTPFEIQMLMGVREDAQRDLAAQGYEVWQYAPYGAKWFSYFYRRVRERKENLAFALRAVAGR
ncbi:proline dehydrogenase family protein [Halegenticoccus tardaugens]|uniref:proline dehydrogenase family protein n=1 Tax=Halegenticoccus tardaugens TaxID=2071624 RepID=UPI00100AD2E7|nr:proline dehydrogenase family protein [Halegenticoccus tardaugens]